MAKSGHRPALRQRLETGLNGIWYRLAPPPWWLRLAGSLAAPLLLARPDRPTERPPVPLIVVGNLVAGGGGKTPLVAAIATELRALGLQVAVISRGYGGAEPSRPLRIEPDTPATIAGDEAAMLARSLELPVWVCRRRRRAMEAALNAGADVIIADDGLQHRDLPRSLEIVVVDGERGFGNGRLLPAGPLRQPLSRLDQVDAVVVKGPGYPRGLSPGAFEVRLEPKALVSGADGNRLPVDSLAPGPVDAVAGIADPGGFFRLLESRGYRLRRHRRPDHHRYVSGELEDLPGPVIVTAKDAVKLGELVQRSDWYLLEVALSLPEDFSDLVEQHVRRFRA